MVGWLIVSGGRVFYLCLATDKGEVGGGEVLELQVGFTGVVEFYDGCFGLDVCKANGAEGVVPPREVGRVGFRLDGFLLVLADVGGEGEESGLGQDHVVVVLVILKVRRASSNLVRGVFVGHEGV